MSRTLPEGISLPRGWSLIADPGNIGWPLILLFTGLVLVDQLVGFGGRWDQATSAWNIIGVVAGLSLVFLLLWGAKATYLRMSFARRHAWVMVVTMFVAMLVGTTSGTSVTATLVDTDAAGPTPVGGDRIIFGTVALVMIAWAIGTLRAYRSAASELQDVQRQLSAATRASHDGLRAERDLVIAPIADSLRNLVDALPDLPHEEAARQLRATATQIVRPASHQLAATTSPAELPEPEPLPRPSWRQTLAQVASIPLLLPVVMAITMVIFVSRLSINEAAGTPTIPRTSDVSVSVDWASLGRAITQLAIVFVAVWLSARITARILRPLLPNRTPALRWVIVLASIPIVAGLAQVIILLTFSVPALSPETQSALRNPWVFIVPLAIIATVTALIRTARVRLVDILRELRDRNAELAFTLARLNEELWMQRRTLSHRLHGPIQGTLNSAAILLAGEESVEDEDPMTGVLIRLNRAIADLEANRPERIDIATELSHIRDTWLGVSHISIQIPPTTLTRIQQDPLCATSFIDIVGEAVANAVIHGRARAITIHVTEHGTRGVRIEAVDDGMGVAARDGGGLGSRLLREACTEWGLAAQEGHTRLFAVVPLVHAGDALA